MTLTPAYRAKLAAEWRALAERALACIAGVGGPLGDLRRTAKDLGDRGTPFEDGGDAYALFALSRLCISLARARDGAARALRGPALTALALLALEILGEPPAPPTFPFRADLDG